MLVFGADRPYPATGLDRASWCTVPVAPVLLDGLHLTQRGVWLHALLHPGAPVGGDPYPHVVAWQGCNYLEDGHTRIARAVLRGTKYTLCRVYVSP